MSRSARTTATLLVAVVLLTVASIPAGAAPTNIGPSTDTAPYVLPVAAGVEVTSILTVADAGAASNDYEMVGIPDGLGAIKQGANAVVYMNHELGQTQGIARRHGQAGAFVSRLVIKRSSLEVKEGSDYIDPGIQYWDYLAGSFADTPAEFAPTNPPIPPTAGLPALARTCSGFLSTEGQLYNKTTKAGYQGTIYFANEEVPDGRVFAVLANGEAFQLPRLGLFAWENTIAASNETDAVVVMGNEDQARFATVPGVDQSQLWVYVGDKEQTGSPIERAGLNNGENHVVRVGDGPMNDAGVRALIAADPDGKVPFTLSEVEWNASATAQNDEALAEGLSLNRIEDGAFDPNDPNVYYFLTTEGAPNSNVDGGGLWRLTFDDMEDPDAGGTLELLLDGQQVVPDDNPIDGVVEAKFNKPDNMTIDDEGNVLIQEDPGNNAHVARIIAYRIEDGTLGVVARFDPTIFSGATPLTLDEESSGIIDMERIFGKGSFLFDAQVHTTTGLDNAAAQVERGQLMLLEVGDWDDVYGS